MARFIQIHWLASYPASLLNRDDAGLAKRMPFGGTIRGRISSQCLKRRWRMAGADSLEEAHANEWALQNIGVPMGYRSKHIVKRRILAQARALQPDATEDAVAAVESELLTILYGKKAEDPKSRQVLFFGEPEVAYLAQKAAEALADSDPKAAAEAIRSSLKNEKGNIKALVGGAGLEAALFGRMVTSDPAANTDAAIHVAHAMTTHAIEREMDFMTAVDDLKRRQDGDDTGAAGVFDMELSSGLYYGYVVIDLPLLQANLSGDAKVAGKVIEHLIHLIAEVSPGAKKGSTAPYAYAEWMMVESGKRQPRTLANAFRTVMGPREMDCVSAANRASEYLIKLDKAYGSCEERRQMSVEVGVPKIPSLGIGELATWAAQRIAE